jgi:hypothetical protein
MRTRPREIELHVLRWCQRSALNVLCVVVCGFAVLSHSGANDTRVVTREAVEELIRSLDANTLAERRRAERQLLDLGPEVLRFLPAPELIESLSAREAIRAIRPQLESRAARESSAASVVTLQGERSLPEIVSELARQSRNRVVLAEGLSDMQVSVDWNLSTFWDCLDDLCARARLEWQFVKDEPAIRISPVSGNRPAILAIQRTGPFRVAVDQAEVRFVVGAGPQKILRLTGRILVEPRLRPLFLSMAARELKAKTNDDRLLPPWNPEAKYELPVGDGSREAAVQWDFRLPTDNLPKSVTIQGQMHCQIAAATERIAFDQKSLTRGTIRRRGGVTVRLRHVNIEPADNELLKGNIGITVSYDTGGPAFESHRSWIFHNAVYLESKSEGRLNYTDFDTTQQEDGAVAVDYRWKGINAPASQYSFVYEAPTLILDVPIVVDIGDIAIERLVQ